MDLLTYTMAKKYTEETVIGKGAIKGEDGFSPIVRTESVSNGTKVTITDADGGKTFVIKNGEKGDKGDKGDDGEDGKKGETPVIQITATQNGDVVPVNKTGTKENPVFNFRFEGEGEGNGKVKMDADSTAKYLNDLLDGVTAKNDDGKVVVKRFDGQEVSVDEINYLKGAKSNLQAQIDTLKGVKSIYAVFNTKAALDADTGSPEDGQLALVRRDETADYKQTSYVYLRGMWEILAEINTEVRDFNTDPIKLTKEVTGILPEVNISDEIARIDDVLDRDTYVYKTGVVKKARQLEGQEVPVEDLNEAATMRHEHKNKDELDNIVDDGDGTKFLSDDGTYKEVKSGKTEIARDESEVTEDTILIIGDTDTEDLPKASNTQYGVAKVSADSHNAITVDEGVLEVKISEDDDNCLYYSSNGLKVENSGGGGESYSATETKIGTWIDGKPIYRLVVDFSEYETRKEYYVNKCAIGLLTLIRGSIDVLIKLTATLYGDGYYMQLPSVDVDYVRTDESTVVPSAIGSIKYEQSTRLVFMQWTGNNTYSKRYAILEYTKN